MRRFTAIIILGMLCLTQSMPAYACLPSKIMGRQALRPETGAAGNAAGQLGIDIANEGSKARGASDSTPISASEIATFMDLFESGIALNTLGDFYHRDGTPNPVWQKRLALSLSNTDFIIRSNADNLVKMLERPTSSESEREYASAVRELAKASAAKATGTDELVTMLASDPNAAIETIIDETELNIDACKGVARGVIVAALSDERFKEQNAAWNLVAFIDQAIREFEFIPENARTGQEVLVNAGLLPKNGNQHQPEASAHSTPAEKQLAGIEKAKGSLGELQKEIFAAKQGNSVTNLKAKIAGGTARWKDLEQRYDQADAAIKSFGIPVDPSVKRPDATTWNPLNDILGITQGRLGGQASAENIANRYLNQLESAVKQLDLELNAAAARVDHAQTGLTTSKTALASYEAQEGKSGPDYVRLEQAVTTAQRQLDAVTNASANGDFDTIVKEFNDAFADSQFSRTNNPAVRYGDHHNGNILSINSTKTGLPVLLAKMELPFVALVENEQQKDELLRILQAVNPGFTKYSVISLAEYDDNLQIALQRSMDSLRGFNSLGADDALAARYMCATPDECGYRIAPFEDIGGGKIQVTQNSISPVNIKTTLQTVMTMNLGIAGLKEDQNTDEVKTNETAYDKAEVLAKIAVTAGQTTDAAAIGKALDAFNQAFEASLFTQAHVTAHNNACHILTPELVAQGGAGLGILLSRIKGLPVILLVNTQQEKQRLVLKAGVPNDMIVSFDEYNDDLSAVIGAAVQKLNRTANYNRETVIRYYHPKGTHDLARVGYLGLVATTRLREVALSQRTLTRRPLRLFEELQQHMLIEGLGSLTREHVAEYEAYNNACKLAEAIFGEAKATGHEAIKTYLEGFFAGSVSLGSDFSYTLDALIDIFCRDNGLNPLDNEGQLRADMPVVLTEMEKEGKIIHTAHGTWAVSLTAAIPTPPANKVKTTIARAYDRVLITKGQLDEARMSGNEQRIAAAERTYERAKKLYTDVRSPRKRDKRNKVVFAGELKTAIAQAAATGSENFLKAISDSGFKNASWETEEAIKGKIYEIDESDPATLAYALIASQISGLPVVLIVKDTETKNRLEQASIPNLEAQNIIVRNAGAYNTAILAVQRVREINRGVQRVDFYSNNSWAGNIALIDGIGFGRLPYSQITGPAQLNEAFSSMGIKLQSNAGENEYKAWQAALELADSV